MYDQRTRKLTARSRLAQLRKKIEELPEATDEEKGKKEILKKELNFEYLDNILGEIEKMQVTLAKKSKEAAKSKIKRKSR
jgi:hypothetical protein